MANEVRIRVTASSGDADAALAKVKAEEDALSKSSENLTKKSKDTKLSIDDLAKSFKATAGQTDDFGMKINENANFAQHLDGELKRLRGEADNLRKSFASTGDSTILSDLKRTLGDVENLSKEAEKSGIQLGSSMGKGVSSGLEDSLPMGLNPAVVGVGLGLATVLTPVIVGAITTAFVTAGGVGMLALGGVIESQDSQVVGAAKNLATDVSNEFKRAAAGLQAPFIASLQELDSFASMFEDTFKQSFDNAGHGLAGFQRGLEGVLQPIISVLPNLTHAFDKAFSDPAVQQSLAGIGRSLANLLGTMSASGSAVKETFIILNGILSVTVTIIDGLINVTNFFGAAMAKAGEFIRHVIDSTPRLVPLMDKLDEWAQKAGIVDSKNDSVADSTRKVGDAAQAAAVDWASYSSQLSALDQDLDHFTQTMVDKVLSAQLGMAQSTLSWNQSLTNLSQTMKDNKRSLDETTEAGQANVSAILQVVAANKATYDAMIQSGAGADAAAAQYDKNTDSLNKMLLKAGYTQGEIDNLIGSMKNVPDKVSADIAMNGLTQAIDDLIDLEREINHLPPRKDIDVYVNYRQTGQLGGSVNGNYTQHASGGPVTSLTSINEHGPELIRLPQGSMVYPAGQSAAMAASAQNNAGQELAVTLDFSGATDSAMATAFGKIVNSGMVTISARYVR